MSYLLWQPFLLFVRKQKAKSKSKTKIKKKKEIESYKSIDEVAKFYLDVDKKELAKSTNKFLSWLHEAKMVSPSFLKISFSVSHYSSKYVIFLLSFFFFFFFFFFFLLSSFFFFLFFCS